LAYRLKQVGLEAQCILCLAALPTLGNLVKGAPHSGDETDQVTLHDVVVGPGLQRGHRDLFAAGAG
jgi:hypothetical protein